MELLAYLVVAAVTAAFTILIIVAHFVSLAYEARNRRRLPPMRIVLPDGIRVDYSALTLTARYSIGCALHGGCVSAGLIIVDQLRITIPLGPLLLLYWLPWAVGGGAIIVLHRWRSAVDARLFGAAASGDLAARIAEDFYDPPHARAADAARPGGRPPGSRERGR